MPEAMSSWWPRLCRQFWKRLAEQKWIAIDGAQSLESYPCSNAFLLGGIRPGIKPTRSQRWHQIRMRQKIVRLDFTSITSGKKWRIVRFSLWSRETVLNKRHGRAKGWSQAGTWLEESSGAWLCMNPQTNLCGIARGGTNTSTAPHTTRPPLVMLWRQQETRLGRMLIKNYRTKYGMNGRKRVEFCRKTALPATSMQQFNQAGGFRHNLGSYDHLRSECPIFHGAEFVSWQFSI